tara:strand:- start:583 stop:1197 length:615 start_codon:yes stop_codon:yes gene_type:complete
MTTINLMKKNTTAEDVYSNDPEPWGQSNFGTKEKKELVIFLCKYCKKNLKINKILELGCGLGYYTELINKKLELKIIGTDISETAINKCDERLKNSIKFQKLDVCNDEDFDIINQIKPDLFLMLDITWFLLDNLKELIKKLKQKFSGKYLLHFLAFPEKQDLGTEYFDSHEKMLEYFDLEYIFTGKTSFHENNRKYYSYFLAKI